MEAVTWMALLHPIFWLACTAAEQHIPVTRTSCFHRKSSVFQIGCPVYSVVPCHVSHPVKGYRRSWKTIWMFRVIIRFNTSSDIHQWLFGHQNFLFRLCILQPRLDDPPSTKLRKSCVAAAKENIFTLRNSAGFYKLPLFMMNFNGKCLCPSYGLLFINVYFKYTWSNESPRARPAWCDSTENPKSQLSYSSTCNFQLVPLLNVSYVARWNIHVC